MEVAITFHVLEKKHIPWDTVHIGNTTTPSNHRKNICKLTVSIVNRGETIRLKNCDTKGEYYISSNMFILIHYFTLNISVTSGRACRSTVNQSSLYVKMLLYNEWLEAFYYKAPVFCVMC